MRIHQAAPFAAFLALAGAGCQGNEAAQAQPAGFPPTPVQVVEAKPAPIEDTTEYVGTLKSLTSTTIQPQVDGQITQIRVKSGDRVSRGDALMQIDQRRQQAAVSNQEAERASKEAERGSREAAVTYARQQQQRMAELYEAKAVSKQELDQAETALRTAEAELKSLQAQVQQQQAQIQEQEVQLRYYTVTAPTSGIVGDVPVRVGMQVSPQTLLTTIDQNDTLEVNVSVPVERAHALKRGLRLEVLNADDRQQIADTIVTFISPRVDEQTQTILVKGAVRNPNGALRSSQLVRARIVWGSNEGLVLPVTAVSRVNGQYFAFVAEDAGGKLVARQRAVKVGQIVGDTYPVLDGIKPGDRVVVSGAQKLMDGAPIAPAPAGAPAAASAPPASQ